MKMRKYWMVSLCFSLMAVVVAAGPAGRVSTADAAIAHQATTHNHLDQDLNPGFGSIMWNHTVNAGADRILIVTTSIDSNSGSVVTAVTFSGHLLTRRAVRDQSSIEQVQLWYMLEPPVGISPVVVEYNNPIKHYGLEARASTYTGVSQNKPISAVQTAGGSSTSASVTIASAVGELVVDALGYRNGGTMSVGSGQTQRYNQRDSINGGAASEEFGDSSVTMSWALQNSATWAMLAASLRPALSPTVRTVTVKPFGGNYTSLNDALINEAADLVALNRQLNIELYAMTDTTPVDLATPAYTTDPDHYIRIYTPASERHAGVWDATKYNLDITAQVVPAVDPTFPGCISIGEVDVWFDGIQTQCNYAFNDFPSMVAVNPGAGGNATLRLSNSIFKGNWSASSMVNDGNFMVTYHWPGTSEMWVWNTIATDFWWFDQTRGRGLHTFGTQGGHIWWSNVTLANMAKAIELDSSTQFHVRNSLAYFPAGLSSWPDSVNAIRSDSDYNASNLAETLQGANSLGGQTFTFQGADDWRLAASDTGAADNGVNSLNSYYLNGGLDVAGNQRDSIWDIGASEFVVPVGGAGGAGGGAGGGGGGGGGCFISSAAGR